MNPHHSSDDCFREVARILAVGILRLRARMALPAGQTPDGKNISESGQDCLEVPDETVLSVHTGKRFPKLRERSKT